jgi:hypothetical protein
MSAPIVFVAGGEGASLAVGTAAKERVHAVARSLHAALTPR